MTSRTPRALAALVLTLVVGSPVLAADRDGDLLHDGFERRWGVTDPSRRDSDRDGVIDSAEDLDRDRLGNLGEARLGTDPGDPDSDDDGTRDGNEDSDRDGRLNAREQDQRAVPAALRPSLVQAKAAYPRARDRCMEPNTGSRARRCRFGDPDAKTRLVLMGDSHALMWLPAVKRSAAGEGWRLITLLRGGCEPTLGTRNLGQHRIDGASSCRRWRSNAVRWLNAHPPDVIVVTHSDTYRLVNAAGGVIPLHGRPRVWARGMARMLAALPSQSRVLLLGDAPKNRENPVKCLMRDRSDMSACVSRRVPSGKRLVEAALRKVAMVARAEHRSLYGQVCTYDPCPLVHGDVLLFRDRGHLTRTFASMLAPSMRRLLVDVLAGTRPDRGVTASA